MHSRWFEGNSNDADLEMAIDIPEGFWLDLVLQAKRMFPSSEYESWKAS